MLNWKTKIQRTADKIWKEIHQKEVKDYSWENLKFNYRAEHTELVLSIGMQLGRELEADMDILRAALLLHDIGRNKVEKGHAKVGAQLACEILDNTDFPREKIDAVSYAIGVHAGWDESIPETLEARILWDADKLSKLGASVILHRTMRIPLKGKEIWDAPPEFNKWLKTAEFIKNHMKTPLGSELAKERFHTLKTFVAALNREVMEYHTD